MPVPPKKITPPKFARRRFVKQSFSSPAVEATARGARAAVGKSTTIAIPVYTPREPQAEPPSAPPDPGASSEPQSRVQSFLTIPKILFLAAALLAAVALAVYFLR
jgi:hypothetical protein